MKNTFLKLFSLLIIAATTSCSTDDVNNEPIIIPPPLGTYENGIFILNEGGFGSSNSSVSFLDEAGIVSNSIYNQVTGANLGDVAQSMGFNGDNAYIIVNNSGTVEVVNRNTFERVATVTTSISNPRFIVFNGDKGYISNWGDPTNPADDYIAVLNLETNLIEATIPVAEGPEKLLVISGKLYVAQKGGFNYGNTVSVINLNSQTVTNEIEVADVPDAIVLEGGKLYVMCSGKAAFTGDETLAKIFRINPLDNTVETSLTFPEFTHPSYLEADNGSLFYLLESDVYSLSPANFQLSNNPLFSPTSDGLQVLYGFGINNGQFYIADAKDFSSNGEVFVYNSSGIISTRFNVGINPNSFYFDNE